MNTQQIKNYVLTLTSFSEVTHAHVVAHCSERGASPEAIEQALDEMMDEGEVRATVIDAQNVGHGFLAGLCRVTPPTRPDVATGLTDPKQAQVAAALGLEVMERERAQPSRVNSLAIVVQLLAEHADGLCGLLPNPEAPDAARIGVIAQGARAYVEYRRRGRAGLPGGAAERLASDATITRVVSMQPKKGCSVPLRPAHAYVAALLGVHIFQIGEMANDAFDLVLARG